jgi:hypothetical protein
VRQTALLEKSLKVGVLHLSVFRHLGRVSSMIMRDGCSVRCYPF